MPWGSDNALVKAAEAVRRLASFRPATQITDIWRGQVDAMHISEEEKAVLLDPQQVWDALGDARGSRESVSRPYTTISPNVIHPVESQKTNVIPDVVDLVVDIRTLPGTTEAEVIAMITEALGDLAPHVEIGEAEQQAEGTQSSIDTPLWDVISHQTQIAYPGAELLPGLVVGGTDARFYRQRGRIGYGADSSLHRWTWPHSGTDSMAITNASTSKASVSLPTSGLASAESSWGEKAMADLETMPTAVVPETEITPDTEEPTSAHIVKVEPGESAAAKVLQARIEGTPLRPMRIRMGTISHPKQLPYVNNARRSTTCSRSSTTGFATLQTNNF